MSENISISGIVQGYNRKAIPGIKVSAYRDRQILDYDFTYNEQGRYHLSVPPGTPITLRFDTHWSLTNAMEWHPSVFSNIDAKQNMLLPNRFLLRVLNTTGQIDFIDALSAYQFCALWTAIDPNRDTTRLYAETAAARLSAMKFIIPELSEIQQILIKFFRKLAYST